jgi:quercetin dioxygenase-like cupin family protein
MTNDRPTAVDALEAAALAALGERPDAAAAEPGPGHDAARDEFSRVVSELAFAAPSAGPPKEVRARLLDRVAAESAAAGVSHPEGSFFPKPGVFGVRTSEARWEKSPLPGIETKLLFQDRENGTSTRLVRFLAGTRYPRHAHAGREEIFVLEGSLRVNGVLLVTGDYCRSEPGVEEAGTVSETGGLALIVSCDADEVLPDGPAA